MCQVRIVLVLRTQTVETRLRLDGFGYLSIANTSFMDGGRRNGGCGYMDICAVMLHASDGGDRERASGLLMEICQSATSRADCLSFTFYHPGGRHP